MLRVILLDYLALADCAAVSGDWLFRAILEGRDVGDIRSLLRLRLLGRSTPVLMSGLDTSRGDEERCFNGFDEVASWVTVIGDAVLDRLPLFFFGEAAVGFNFTGLLLALEPFVETEEDFET